MKDDQLLRPKRFIQPPPPMRALLALPLATRAAPTALATPVQRLTWDEMQRRRAQGLCFNCNEYFTAGHRCQGTQILMLEGHDGSGNIICDDVTEEQPTKKNHEELLEPDITLSAPRTTRKPTTRQKSSTAASNSILGVSFTSGHANGTATYLGLNIGTTTYHISIGMNHFQALYGRLPPSIPLYNEGFLPVHEVDQHL
ncbi:hypothetical protein F0562_017852 [Nyssa sinensis]|uniref:Uncharacterized protein n=1 Tax=Nyssa sinensis TaxID=561372 RepID=A0A5J4ZJ25_9ASTE|nr:hypothetical protein F0562_017852 [Nyssa sinensis]